jgi:hypothetical protein
MGKFTRFDVFVTVFIVLAIANLLVANDYTFVWSGAEAYTLFYSLKGEWIGYWPTAMYQALSQKIDTFAFRFPSVWLFAMAAYGLFFFTKKMLGKSTALLSLLILGGSILVPNWAKLASGDVWAFGSQALVLMSMLLALKQPKLNWQALHHALVILAISIQPVTTIVLVIVAWVVLYFLHPQGKNLIRLPSPILVLLLGFLFNQTGFVEIGQEVFALDYFNAPFGKFLTYSFLGMLPFIGFIFAGLRELFTKVGKKEELAIIHLALLLSVLLAQSMAFQCALVLIIAKHMQAYFVKNYPYQSFVKTGAVLHLVGFFVLATVAMMSGFQIFRGVGFRAALSVSIIYWIWSFVSVLGLYGQRKDWVWGGVLSSGLLASLIFWLQLNPVLNNERRIYSEAIQKARVMKTADQEALYLEEGMPFPATAVYAIEAFPNTQIGETKEGSGIYINTTKPASITADSISGRDERLNELTYWIYKK